MTSSDPNQQVNSAYAENEIDLKELILPVWKGRKQILLSAFLFAVLGGVLGFLTPVTFTASSTFLPQTTQSGGVESNLGGLAALAGINLNASTSGGDIPPTMYARVLGSEPFRMRLLDAKIWLDGDTISYRNYLLSRPSSIFGLGTIKDYTIGLPVKMLTLLTGDKKEAVSDAVEGLQALSDKEYALHQELSGKIKIDIDKKEGVVSITVIESDAMLAAQVAKVTEEVLQEWIIEHKIKNARTQYDFIAKQFEAKQKEFFSVQDQLALYMERNQNMLSAPYMTRLERLQAEFDLMNAVYTELAKQKEQAAIQLSKDTPTFSVLDPVKIPREKTEPKKSLYILGAFFMGLIFSAAWFLARKPIQEFFKGMQVES